MAEIHRLVRGLEDFLRDLPEHDGVIIKSRTLTRSPNHEAPIHHGT